MNKKYKISIVSVLLFFCFSSLWAQDEKKAFTLEEAKAYASQNSYVIQNSNNDILKAKKEIWKTITIGLPHVNASMDYTKNITAASSPFPVALIPQDFWESFGIPADTPPTGTVPLSFSPKFSSGYSLTVNQLIFDGSYIVGVNSSKLYLDLAKKQYEKTEIDILEAVSQAYYTVLIAQESLTTLKDNVENAKKIYNDTKAYYEAGYREEQDADQMLLLVKTSENEVSKTEREIDIAKTVLKFTMGYDLSEEIILTDSLEQFVYSIVDVNVDEPFDFKEHIDYQLAYSNTLVKDKMINLQKVSFLPQIGAFYTYGRQAFGSEANLFKDEVSWNPMQMIGLNISMPIFDSGEKVFKLQQAKIDYETAQNNLYLTEQSLVKDYLTSLAQLETALEQFNNAKESRKLALNIYEKTKVKFDYGMVGSIEVAQANNQFVQAHGNYIAAALQLLQANLTLKKIKGKL